jgi:hypothetical protein
MDANQRIDVVLELYKDAHEALLEKIADVDTSDSDGVSALAELRSMFLDLNAKLLALVTEKTDAPQA